MRQTGFIVALLMGIFLCVNLGYSCSYKIELSDPGYGDGWNGGNVSVYVDAVEVLNSLTLSSGSGPAIFYFDVETGDVISTDYTAGSWSYENYYAISDADGNLIAGSGYPNGMPGDMANIIAVCPVDSDDDGVFDSDEGTGDRDNDGIPDYNDYDPTGFFYDEADGRIIPGGSIEVEGPGTINLIYDGSNSFYQFTTDGTQGTYTIIVTLPPDYEWSQSCLDQGTLDPTGENNPYVLGNDENSDTGFLNLNQCTAFYLQFDLESGDPLIFNNNIPLALVQATSIPIMNE